MMDNEFHAIDLAVLQRLVANGAVWANNRSSGACRPEYDQNDPHWKRVAKDRARRKAAKKHKQHMRRSGRG
jgi:hypothetical protein